MRIHVVAAALACLVACYSPQLQPCEVHCEGASNPCPGDMTCAADNFCHAAGDNATCGSGSGSGTDAPPGTFVITVQKQGGGTGNVTSDGDIDCGQTCTAELASGDSITLSEVPDSNSLFVSWGGDCNPLDDPCVLVADANKTAVATFALAVNVEVDFFGQGDGQVASAPPGIACNDASSNDCAAVFAQGTQLTLTATPNPDGSVFGGWGGSCAGQLTETCTFTVTSDAVVQLDFD